ncbi:MAG: hypothetical protein JSS20_03285 [Proteobacteria bacterium]|nr:hypothetical protein [Pseudomonadota bacterium]
MSGLKEIDPPLPCRIHVTGGSGAGVTTLGRELAQRFGVPHADTDDYYWLPTEPPFSETRPRADRIRLMRELFLPRVAWVLSGSLDSWGGEITEYFDLVVFVDTPTAVRLARLEARERRRYGAAAVAPGGSRHEAVSAFLDWAAHYDDGLREGRSRFRHETWLGGLKCPVVRLDGALPVAGLIKAVEDALPRRVPKGR